MPKNDPPTSFHRIFGYRQASRALGLEGIRPDRSPRQVNRITKENRATRDAIRELREAKDDPDWVSFIKHRASEGHSAEQIATELYWIKRYSRMRAAGISVAGCLRYHWPYSN